MYEHLHPVWLLVGAFGALALTFVILVLLVALHPGEDAPKTTPLGFREAELTALGACLFGLVAAWVDNLFLDVAHNNTISFLAGVVALFVLQVMAVLVLGVWTLRLTRRRRAGHGGTAIT